MDSASIAAKLLRRSHEDRVLLLEAMTCLALARLAVAFLPFRLVGRLASRPVTLPPPTEQARMNTRERIRWAVAACARRVPWRAMCFEQGLAAQVMLRRSGVPSTLCFGALPGGPKGVTAHVWVRDGDIDVIGGEAAARFALLATFPNLEEPRQPS